jgi:hypothetical protein
MSLSEMQIQLDLNAATAFEWHEPDSNGMSKSHASSMRALLSLEMQPPETSAENFHTRAAVKDGQFMESGIHNNTEQFHSPSEEMVVAGASRWQFL